MQCDGSVKLIMLRGMSNIFYGGLGGPWKKYSTGSSTVIEGSVSPHCFLLTGGSSYHHM